MKSKKDALNNTISEFGSKGSKTSQANKKRLLLEKESLKKKLELTA
jgi:hypothetical protein